jgi:hypothetical protein
LKLREKGEPPVPTTLCFDPLTGNANRRCAALKLCICLGAERGVTIWLEIRLFDGFSILRSPDFLPKEKSNMKKRSSIPIMVFLTCFPLGVQAGQNTGAPHDQTSDARKFSRKITGIPGKVGSDGKTFTADKDSRIWMVDNPEALSAIAGRHVKVKALVDAARSQLRIVSVSAIAEQRAGIKLDDAAFRR